MARAPGVIAAAPPSCQSWASVLTVVDRGGGRLTPRALDAEDVPLKIGALMNRGNTEIADTKNDHGLL